MGVPGEETGGLLELGEHAAMPRLETSGFGGSELFGNGKLGEAHERLVDVLEALLELGGGGRGGGARCGLGPDHTERCPEKLTSVGLAGDTVGGEEPERLA